MFASGTIVLCHLVSPTEKFWGVLESLDATGILIKGIKVESFDDWMMQAGRKEKPTLGLSSMFVPLFRVERVFLDEQVGEVQSYRQRFEERVGTSVEAFLGLAGVEDGSPPS